MLSLEEARERILKCFEPRAAERIPATQALGRFLAEPLVARIDLPGFDNSAMDGYAVRAADVANAKANSPIALKLLGMTPAGDVFSGALGEGCCVRLFTGSAVPAGADAVVMQEDTQVDAVRPDEVLVLDPVKPWENVRFRSEDVKRGTTVVPAGERLTAMRLGLAAALGCDALSVRQRPVVGLLATGSELVEPGRVLAPGKIFESNRVALASLLAQASAVPRVFPLVADTLEATRRALNEAFSQCDAVVTTGGVSVGELDFVKNAFESLGGRMEFWKVSIRPGKPFVFGRLGGKFLFGLPGNPVSAVVTFLLLVRPALLRWQGATQIDLPSNAGTLAEPLVNQSERRHFVRVRVDSRGEVRPTGTQASHLLGSLAHANGLVDVPAKATLAAGSAVVVLRLES